MLIDIARVAAWAVPHVDNTVQECVGIKCYNIGDYQVTYSSKYGNAKWSLLAIGYIASVHIGLRVFVASS